MPDQNFIPWQPFNHGAGARRWFLAREDSVPVEDRYYENASGQLVRYVSYKTASAAAERLNAAGKGAA